MSGQAEVTLISAPLPAGRIGEWRAFLEELKGPRRAEWDDHQRRLGVVHEYIWHQVIDGTDVVILCIAGPSSTQINHVLADSSHEFDRWFHDRLHDILGYVTEYPAGTTEPVLVGVWKEEN